MSYGHFHLLSTDERKHGRTHGRTDVLDSHSESDYSAPCGSCNSTDQKSKLDSKLTIDNAEMSDTHCIKNFNDID